MDLSIKGKWALVCAASKGLGKGCALALNQVALYKALGGGWAQDSASANQGALMRHRGAR
jgi:3-oxoacyl-[acyl-carrier protein] reductase